MSFSASTQVQLDSLVTENYNLGADEWEYFEKTAYSYDGNGNEIERIIYLRTFDQWEAYKKEEYTYDSDNKLTSKTYSYWDGSQWILSYRDEYSYDTNDNLTLAELNAWDGYSFVYPLYKETYSYDVNNNLIEEIGEGYEEDIGSFQNTVRRTYSYDANNRLIERLISFWDIYSLTWFAPSNKTEYSYDSDNNRMLAHYFEWDFNQSVWVNDFRYFYAYDNTLNYNDLFLPNGFTEPEFKHKRDTYLEEAWNVTTEQWNTSERGTYYYSGDVLNIENIVEAGIQVFPNPAQEYVVFDLANSSKPARIELYDAQGKLADNQVLTNNQIVISHLNSGVYFYQLFHAGEQYGGRLVVK